MFVEMGRAFGVRDVLRGVPDGPLCIVLTVASPAIISLVRTLAQSSFPKERVIISVGARGLLGGASAAGGATPKSKSRGHTTG